jgi:squalene-hopene/tetraprenyl-beta-curcumene cyclase
MTLGAIVATPLCVLCVASSHGAADATVPLRPVSQSSASVRPTAAWDPQAAARYLDERMDLWFAKARTLQTGEGKTTCVSCHITVPYVLVRPALRRAMGVSQPMPQETKLIHETLLRVATYTNHEALLKGKDEQSRGSEAVLNVLVLISESAGENRPELRMPIVRALDELWAAQRVDGAWDWLDTGMEPYESSDSIYYGAALAAIAVGTGQGYGNGTDGDVWGGVGRLRSYLKAHYAQQNLYNKTWALLASTRLPGVLRREQMAELVGELRKMQNPDGGWSLYRLGPWTWSKPNPPYAPKGKPDLSALARSDGFATGFIAYALRQEELPVADLSLRRARAWLEANQQECQIDQSRWKCWRTYSLNFDTEHGGEDGEPWRRMFMSDAATAFAALALLPCD